MDIQTLIQDGNNMDLKDLREQINGIDKELIELFNKRMEICLDVARYKIENDLPVFQTDREKEIVKKVRESSPEWLENGSEVLFTTIMDISKSLQYQQVFAASGSIPHRDFIPGGKRVIACPGTEGSYSHIAAGKIFPEGNVMFFEDFEDVFKAVVSADADFGIMPIQNSTAGSVHQAYELLKKYDCHIAAATKVKVSHCLAVRKETDFSAVKTVYSHEQALAQCSEFIKEAGLSPEKFANTALAAEFIKESDEPLGAICSEECANRLGLKIVNDCITNADENYTRFILLSRNVYSSDKADIISISLSLPHERSALYRLLTKFSVVGLNLLRIESRPIASRDFDVVFYLDFEGSISNPEVSKLIAQLQSELSYFRFLGNYCEID